MVKPTNTLIITDKYLLEPANSALLDNLLTSLKDILPKNESLQITKLNFFNRILLIFDNKNLSQEIFNLLTKEGIKVSFSQKDNEINSDLNSAIRLPDFNTTNEKLYPPKRKVEMQSPPPSPYLGWTNKPEDPPHDLTISDPKSLSHILYHHEGKVFDDVVDVNMNGSDNDNDLDDIPILLIDKEEAETLREFAKTL